MLAWDLCVCHRCPHRRSAATCAKPDRGDARMAKRPFTWPRSGSRTCHHATRPQPDPLHVARRSASPFFEEPVSCKLDAYPEACAAVRYSFTPAQRGDHTTGKLYVRYRSNHRARRALGYGWSHPDCTHLSHAADARRESPLSRAASPHRTADAPARQRGMGRDFESLRDYLEGDEIRDICWTASARRGSLVTRLYEMEKSQAVWLVLDAGRLQARARGTLHQAGPGDGRRAGAGADRAYVRRPCWVCSRMGATRSSSCLPGRGAAHLRVLLDALAQVRAGTARSGSPACSGDADASPVASQPHPVDDRLRRDRDAAGGAGRGRATGATASGALHRHLAARCAAPGRRSRQRRWMRCSRPRLRRSCWTAASGCCAGSQERGAMTLETQPESLAVSVLNRYLEVKEQGLL